jgi:membrane fusion protein (multidrug efflux system)
MNAEMLESTPSVPTAEVNYKVPVASPSPPLRRWRKSLVFSYSLGVLVLLASIVTVAISLHSHASSSAKPSTPAPKDTKPWNASGNVDIEGGITAVNPAQMGRVKSIEVKEDQLVEEGKPLFYLDDTVPQLKVKQAKAGVEAAQGQIKIAQAEADALDKKIAAQQKAIELARIEVERAHVQLDEKQKFKEKGIGIETEAKDAELLLKKAQKAVEAAQAQLTSLKALKGKAAGSIDMAQANLKEKQTLLAEAENAVKECVVRAPVKGRPLRINITKGEVLGANPRQTAMLFAAEESLMVRGEVEQEFVGRVKLKQEVTIEDQVTENEIGSGLVERIARWYAPRRSLSAEVLPTNYDTRSVECIIRIKSPAPEIRLGQRVRLKFHD